MVLKSVAAGILVGIAAEIRQDHQRCPARIFRLGLNRMPQFGAESVRPLNALDIHRVGSGVSHVDIVHRYPEKTRGQVPHKLAGYID